MVHLKTPRWPGALSRSTGAVLASVRHNGVNRGQRLHGQRSIQSERSAAVAYFNGGFAQGWGFRMEDGVFANGGGLVGSPDLQMGYAGFDEGNNEASFDTGVAYFPYAQGWVGAWVNGADAGEAAFNASSMGLPTSTVNWTDSQATVLLPGVNSATDGMLFVAPTDADNASNIAAAFPNAGRLDRLRARRQQRDPQWRPRQFSDRAWKRLPIPLRAVFSARPYRRARQRVRMDR